MRSFELSFTVAVFAAQGLVAQAPQPKMGAPLAGLTAPQMQRFVDGRVDFTHQTTVGEGLGPIFNQSACSSCHNNPVGGPGSITVTRFGYLDGKGTFDPLASLGGSLLQQLAIDVACQEIVPSAANVTATRVTTSTLGLGLIEAIADADIAANELTPPAPGISGRVHWVHELENPTGPLRAGRFGWKAQLATVLSFSGDASQNEMGFTNRLLPTENAPNGNLALLAAWDGVADPEDGPDANGLHFIDRITDFQRYLAAPPQTPRAGMAGEAIFNTVGCAACHVRTFTTANDPALEAALRNKIIHPYSDFLVHDMGVAADFIEQGGASGQEVRTPPLWGLRNRDPLWHDGRVAGGTLETRMLGPAGIIFQHAAFGSEAAASAAAFSNLTTNDQLQVVAFLDSLGRAEFDWNGDNMLDQVDLAAFRDALGGGPFTADDPKAIFDIDQNGFVDSVDLAAFATVYEVDCNGSGGTDLADVLAGLAADSNGNYIPDVCEHCQLDLGFAGGGSLLLTMCGDVMTKAGSVGTFELSAGPANAPVLVGIGIAANPHLVTATEFLVPLEPLVALVVGLVTDANGGLRVPIFGGGVLPTSDWVFQAATFDGVNFDLSNAVQLTVGGF
ncbi:MAG: hypothetical protein K8J09_06565 [Planctomycetes bacterium]|nr:hypothetical protein [Planctomycetota bacterium]MCC7399778.1 hypothetical protein [Planctomycetota bacterium]